MPKWLRTFWSYLVNAPEPYVVTAYVSTATTLNDLGDQIIATAASKGWKNLTSEAFEDDYRIPAAVALIHTEASEIVEAFRKGDKVNMGEEYADVIIRAIGQAKALGYDVDMIVHMKMEKNKGRAHKHGGKRI